MTTLQIHSRRKGGSEAGSSLIEVMVAGLVFMVGLMGGMALMVTAIAGNNRSKMDSTATLVAQRTMETIASVPANASSTMTIKDCNPDTSQASHSVYTLGTAGGSGAPLSGGGIDFSSTKVAGYWMTYYACQTSSGDQQGAYDVRWYVKTITGSAKLVVVAAERTGTQSGSAKNFIRPVSLKMIVGL